MRIDAKGVYRFAFINIYGHTHIETCVQMYTYIYREIALCRAICIGFYHAILYIVLLHLLICSLYGILLDCIFLWCIILSLLSLYYAAPFVIA